MSDGALFSAEQLAWIYHLATNQGSFDWGIVNTDSVQRGTSWLGKAQPPVLLLSE